MSPALRLPVDVLTRRSALRSVAAAALALGVGRARAMQTPGPRARLTAEFEPQAALWLGYGAGHAPFTAELAAALQPQVPLKLLVRDDAAESAARELLVRRGLEADRIRYVRHGQAPFFVRDAAVFAHDDDGALGLVDFRYTHYGWATWCRQRHDGQAAQARRCAALAALPAGDALDRRLASVLQATVFDTPLAMEGGGVEVNGQGLLIANEALWLGRNPGAARAAIERQLLQLPGVRKVIWLPAGLAQDPLHRGTIVGRHVAWGTGGHTDEFVRFADERTVLLAWVDADEAARHPVARLNRQRMQRNLAVLSRSTDAQGRPLRVLKLPLPRVVERPVVLAAGADPVRSEEWTADFFAPRERRRQGDRLWQVASTSYLNFVITNGLVLVPDYLPHGTPAGLQARVHEQVSAAFPGRRVQFIDAIGANWVGGGPHCATLSEPASAG